MTKSSPSHHSATTETTFRFSCKLGAMQVLQAAWPEVRSRELSPQISPAPMHRLRPCVCRPRVGAHPPYWSRRLYHEVFPEHAAHSPARLCQAWGTGDAKSLVLGGLKARPCPGRLRYPCPILVFRSLQHLLRMQMLLHKDRRLSPQSNPRVLNVWGQVGFGASTSVSMRVLVRMHAHTVSFFSMCCCGLRWGTDSKVAPASDATSHCTDRGGLLSGAGMIGLARAMRQQARAWPQRLSQGQCGSSRAGSRVCAEGQGPWKAPGQQRRGTM